MSLHPAAPVSRLQATFAAEEYAALRLLTRARLVVIGLLLFWVHVENPMPMAMQYSPFVLAYLVPTLLPYLIRRAGSLALWPRYLCSFLDVLLMVIIALGPNVNDFPPQMLLRFGNELYLFLLVSSTALSYAPGVVLWTGCSAAVLWTIGNLWIYAQPDTVMSLPGGVWESLTPTDRLSIVLDPHRVNAEMLGRQVLLLLVIAVILALAVRRSRDLLRRQTEIERERANLSRYFSPNMVEELSQSDEPLRSTRTQDVAVLFVDLVGFTRWSADRSPSDVIDVLREFHRMVAGTVFEHGGTLDKYLGDGAMATFGTPRVAADDARRALLCARTLVTRIAAWGDQRHRDGEMPLRVGVGLHFGAVVLGDIGDERQLEFAVIGDTVNVASRLQELTRSLGTPLVASAAVVAAAARAPGFEPALLEGMMERGDEAIRGRDQGVRIWTQCR